MLRKIIILTCCFNGLLGIGVLWFILTPNKGMVPFAAERSLPSQSPAQADTAELWAMAQEAGTTREAYQYLMALPAERESLQKMNQQIGTLGERAPLPYTAWPFYEALLQSYGSHTQDAADLLVLAQVAAQADQALTLRDIAFRVFIENFGRIEGASPQSAYKLIDTLYENASSLAGTALQAEAFLMERGIERTGSGLPGEGTDDAGSNAPEEPERVGQLGRGALAKRAKAMLLDRSAIENNRLTAAGVLSGLEERPDTGELRAAFESTESEQLKIALIQLMDVPGRSHGHSDTDAAPSDLSWLKDYRPVTPNLERQLYHLLGKQSNP